VNRVDVYPFIEAEKQNSHIDQDGQSTAPGSVALRGNVKRACELLEVSRSAYYQHRALRAAGGSTRHRQDAALTEKIRTIHTGSGGTYGSPRVHAELTDQGIRLGRKRVARLMRADGLVGVTPKRWITTTTPDPDMPARPDLIGRDFTLDPDATDTRWCGDITYIRTWEGWLFLATVIDLASRRVVGWATADHLRTDLIEDALRQAVTARRPQPGVVFHSDRGCQGGLNWSSQHLLIMEVFDGATSAAGGSGSAAGDAFAGPADAGAACGARVLASDCAGQAHRGGCAGDRRVVAGRGALVSSRWRHAAAEPG
jgi:hypothetical protein